MYFQHSRCRINIYVLGISVNKYLFECNILWALKKYTRNSLKKKHKTQRILLTRITIKICLETKIEIYVEISAEFHLYKTIWNGLFIFK